MKTLKYSIVALILISIILGCKKTEESIAPSLSVNPTSKDIESTAGNFNIVVTSTVAWSVSCDKNWILLDPMSGSGNATVKADFQDNTSATSRTASIVFKGVGVEDRVVSVTQLGIQPILTVSPANLSVAANAGNAVINITSNLSWTVTSNQTWCTLDQSSGIGNAALNINYQPNTVQSQRTAIITFTANGVTNQTVQVAQAEFVPVLSVTPSNQTVNSPSGSAIFNITSNISWTATCAESWCTIANPGGTNNGTLSVIYNENTTLVPRTATINVTGEGVANQSVTLTQANLIPTLSVTPSNRDVAKEAGTTTFNITSNTSWTAESNQIWCSVQNVAGNGNATLNINFDQNENNNQRVASITISAIGISSQTVTVIQAGLVPTAGLVAWYPFNGNANDESGNGFNGTVNGATLTNDRFGNVNSAYDFSGTDKYISLGNVIDNLPNLTMTGWFNLNENNNEICNILAKPYAMTITTHSLSYVFSVCDGTTNWSYNYADNIVILNSWMFFSITFNNNLISKIYLNGVLLNKETLLFSIGSNSNPLHVGIWLPGQLSFPGQIDDIRIYNRVLNSDEILQLYNE